MFKVHTSKLNYKATVLLLFIEYIHEQINYDS